MPFLPKQAAETCFKRAHRFINLANNRLPVRAVKDDLRRMALVMAVAAVDSYMHALVHRRISDVRRSADLPKALARIDIPFSDLAALADSSIAAQREQRSSRPWVQVKSSLQKRLLRETFQSYDQVANALAIAGIEKGWKKIAKLMNTNTESIQKSLNNLVYRRNQIVHEGDLKRQVRPQRRNLNDIDRTVIKEQVEWVERLISAIEYVIENDP